MKSAMDFKFGLLSGFRVAIDHLKDQMREYEDGSSERLALDLVLRDLELNRDVVRDTSSFLVRETFLD